MNKLEVMACCVPHTCVTPAVARCSAGVGGDNSSFIALLYEGRMGKQETPSFQI